METVMKGIIIMWVLFQFSFLGLESNTILTSCIYFLGS